jgi:tryptophan synthase alpha chain
MIHLLAPTSTDERVQMIAKCGRGFIYYVSLTGTTGVRAELSAGLRDKVGSIKQAANIPVLVGFGISNPETARNAARISDGVIVGSAIVNLIEKNSDPSQRSKSLAEFIGSIKQAINEIN